MEEKIKNSDSLIKMKGAEGKEMTVLYYGPIAPAGKPSIGGFESANRKNIDKLRELGVKVVEHPNPLINHRFGPLGKLAYAKLLFNPFCLLGYAFRKNVIVHTTPIAHNYLIYPYLLLLLMAKAVGIKTVVDIRAGAFLAYLSRKRGSNRRPKKLLLKLADAITVESASYVDGIKAAFGIDKEIVYFPNITNKIADCPKARAEDKINLFYFGRITATKGIDVILGLMRNLDERYHLYLAGGIAPDVDPASLESEKITYLGKLTPTQLERQLKKMHFFIFPTRHDGEGQSNSLIEAMGAGLVPVTSSQGFCGEVVADCGFVLPVDSTADDYARVIREIDAERQRALSAKCVEHIRECHNIDTEIPKLVQLYRRVLSEN